MKQIKYAFRMVHIKNIPHILQYGIVRKDSPNANPEYVPIGDATVIRTRQNKRATDDTPLSEYIPFYFGPRSPMLYVIQHGYNGVKHYPPSEIVYCVVKIEDITNSGIDCCFTDGHAINAATSFYAKSQLPELNTFVKYEDVFREHWSASDYGDEVKRKKEAELLIKDDIPVQYIDSFVVYHKEVRQRLVEMGVTQPIYVSSQFYY